jgi:hypothetical protein
MPEPVELFNKVGVSAGWKCSGCFLLYPTEANAFTEAQKCCELRLCKCGLVLQKFRIKCDVCSRKEQDERCFRKEMSLFDKAKKLKPDEWDEPVFDRGMGYYFSLEDFLDSCEEKHTWVWCSKRVEFEPDVDHMIENALDQHHEDAGEQISSANWKELEDFVKEWAKKINIVSHEIDYSQCVVIGEGEEPDEEETIPYTVDG